MQEVSLPHEGAVKWACRRGMRELDWLLAGFFNKRYTNLFPEEKKHFYLFLREEDSVLYQWLMIPQTAPSHFQSLIKDIRNVDNQESLSFL